MYGLSLVANPAGAKEVDAGVSYRTGVLKFPIKVTLRDKAVITLPTGTGVRVYKGTFGVENILKGRATPKKLSTGVLRWFVEATPPSGQAWYVYTKKEGLPPTYLKTWNAPTASGWQRFGQAYSAPNFPMEGGYPDIFVKTKPSLEVASDTKTGSSPPSDGKEGKVFSDSYGDLEKVFEKSEGSDPLADGKGKGGGSPGGIVPVPGLKVPGSNIFIPWLVIAGAGVGLALNAPLGLALVGAGLIQDARS
jgi:hypothetical protein